MRRCDEIPDLGALPLGGDHGEPRAFGIGATNRLEDKAATSLWIGHIGLRGCKKKAGECVGWSAIGPQYRLRRQLSFRVPLKHPLKEGSFAALSGIEAGRLDSERVGQRGDPDTVIAMRMEETLADRDARVGIEGSGASSPAQFCSVR
jgi:hypothetical protein